MSRLERDRAASLEASKASQAQAKRENAKQSSFTPGPWVLRTIGQPLATVETQDGRYTIGHAGQLREDDWKTGHIERRSNARLIAAAPELLDALIALLGVAPSKAPGAGLIVGAEEKHANALQAARAAIKKATGDA